VNKRERKFAGVVAAVRYMVWRGVTEKHSLRACLLTIRTHGKAQRQNERNDAPRKWQKSIRRFRRLENETDTKEAGMKPMCMIEGCCRKADFQIGNYIPFKATPRFYCAMHLPKWAREKIERGEFIDTDDIPHEAETEAAT
jgi:hypothetical protein